MRSSRQLEVATNKTVTPRLVLGTSGNLSSSILVHNSYLSAKQIELLDLHLANPTWDGHRRRRNFPPSEGETSESGRQRTSSPGREDISPDRSALSSLGTRFPLRSGISLRSLITSSLSLSLVSPCLVL